MSAVSPKTTIKFYFIYMVSIGHPPSDLSAGWGHHPTTQFSQVPPAQGSQGPSEPSLGWEHNATTQGQSFDYV